MTGPGPVPRPDRVVPLGDRALVVGTADIATAHALAERLGVDVASGHGPGGVREVVVGHANVVVLLDDGPDGDDVPDRAWPDRDGVGRWLGAAAAAAAGAAGARGAAGPRRATRHHELPVDFDGADLGEVAERLGTTPEGIVDLLVGADLEVAFVGFAPGFPYLVGLPADLAALPRRNRPRTAVPAGSVAVAGGFAAVYPGSSPGGWHLLGRTGVPLFDPEVPPHSLVAPGDRVRFVPTGTPGAPSTVPPAGAPSARAPLVAAGACLEVLDPGLATTVQDAGRRGVAALGVPTAGAADPEAADLVRRLLGDGPGTAVLECTARGPALRMVGDGHVAVVCGGAGAGAVEVTVDGRTVSAGAVLPVADGQVVRVGRTGGALRAYLGVAGGLTTPVVLGSRSSDVLAGLGPGSLRPGDRLSRGRPGPVRGRLDAPPAAGGTRVVRVVPGPDGGPDAARRLAATGWTVGPDGDRIGVRLDATTGPGVDGGPPRPSTPMVTGAVQVPPDGRPILLLPDHATVGGYPVVACVVAADLPVLGRLAPGDTVEVEAVDLATADHLARRARAARAAAVSGWFPTRAGT